MSANRSESIGQLAAALSLAQGEIIGAVKDSENPFFKSSYADLASVWDAIRAPLTKNGLAVIQTTEVGEQVELVTTLAHSSGEWVSSSCPIFAKELSPQAIGSAITYARRYGLASIVGVAQIDDDGNAAQEAHRAPSIVKTPPQSKQPAGKGSDPTYAPGIRAAMNLAPDDDKQIKEVASAKGLKYAEALIQGWAAGQRNFEGLMAWLSNYGLEVVHVEEGKFEQIQSAETAQELDAHATPTADPPSPFEGSIADGVWLGMTAKNRLLFKAACDKQKCDHEDVLAQFLESGAEYSHDALMAFLMADQGVML